MRALSPSASSFRFLFLSASALAVTGCGGSESGQERQEPSALAAATAALRTAHRTPLPERPHPDALSTTADAAESSVVTYWQLGADSSSADKVTYDNDQGSATELLVLSEQLNGGGCHYYWVGGGIKSPGQNNIFAQIGYALCGSNPAVPFMLSEGSILPNSNQFLFFDNVLLHHDTWYEFGYSTDGVLLPDGNYSWQFFVHQRGKARQVLTTIEFESPDATAPYLDSEIASYASPCNDQSAVRYDEGSALLTLHKGAWTEIPHAFAFYFYGPCSDSNVKPRGFQSIETILGPGVTQKTAFGTQVW